MSDLIDRLQAANISGHGSYSALVREAADEIERLVALNAQMSTSGLSALKAVLDERKALEAQIERLRAIADTDTPELKLQHEEILQLRAEVERLRAWAKQADGISGECAAIIREQYAEIEQLRELKTPASRELLNITKGCLDNAAAEIERLRAALELIACESFGYECRTIAQRALEQSPPEQRHLTPEEQQVMHDALRASSKPVEQSDAETAKQKVERMLGPDHPTCLHKHYSFEEHGRRCSCGTLMVDFGD